MSKEKANAVLITINKYTAPGPKMKISSYNVNEALISRKSRYGKDFFTVIAYKQARKWRTKASYQREIRNSFTPLVANFLIKNQTPDETK